MFENRVWVGFARICMCKQSQVRDLPRALAVVIEEERCRPAQSGGDGYREVRQRDVSQHECRSKPECHSERFGSFPWIWFHEGNCVFEVAHTAMRRPRQRPAVRAANRLRF